MVAVEAAEAEVVPEVNSEATEVAIEANSEVEASEEAEEAEVPERRPKVVLNHLEKLLKNDDTLSILNFNFKMVNPNQIYY